MTPFSIKNLHPFYDQYQHYFNKFVERMQAPTKPYDDILNFSGNFLSLEFSYYSGGKISVYASSIQISSSEGIYIHQVFDWIPTQQLVLKPRLYSTNTLNITIMNSLGEDDNIHLLNSHPLEFTDLVSRQAEKLKLFL